MQRFAVVLSSVVCVFLAAMPPAGAEPSFSDTLCPRSVPKVIAFNDAAASNDAAKVRVAAHGAADAYRACVTEAQATNGIAIEPRVNYDKTRAAQFLVVAGRLDAASGDVKGASAALRDARSLAVDVTEWQPQSQAYTMSNGGAGNAAERNSDRNGSRYKDAAAEILAAANAELAKLAAPPAPAASPVPAASPKP